ncbi:MAG TPA: hypothetical protein VGV12_13630 [Gemmatimonadales bacterium]|nr:hypothetical protein [Gemmatimonadales bacterium]
MFDHGFTAPRVWRASLGFVQRLWERSWGTFEFNYARGVSQYGFSDLNLVRQPGFTLPEEANRPVWVSPDSIVPETGALSSSSSRIHPDFGKALAIRSDLRSDTKQLTLSFAGAAARGAVVRLSYTLTWSRDQSSFACCVASQGFSSPTTGSDPNALEWGRSDLERRHAFLGTVAYPLSSGLEIGVIAGLLSGIPYTPSVDADINGDGSRNDRAFIFDPRTTTDTTVARSMAALLASAPSGVRACLERQLGRIAGRNSCTGPWQPSFDLQLNWRPQWFGSERRLTLSILTVNLLGGIDAWMHGADQLRGWGYASAPDRVLLYVQGFDRATLSYRYGVNGRFGSATTTGNGVIVPFQVGFQGRVAIGPRRPHRPRADRVP